MQEVDTIRHDIKPVQRYSAPEVTSQQPEFHSNQQQTQAPKRSGFFGGFGSSQNISERATEYSGIDSTQFEEDDDYESNTSKNTVDEDDYMVPPFLRNRR